MKLFLIGGFLGSGKTTAIISACHNLLARGQKVAVITNDQGDQQVDSELVKSLNIPGREVANSCFCCNYTMLDQHIQSLMESDRPDVIFAESVGSCADLVATIAKPLNQFRPALDVVISVFADAALLLALMEGRADFIKDNVRYIYKKQLEEADIIVLNKMDLVTTDQLTTIKTILAVDYPGKKLLFQNSFDKKNVDYWLSVAHTNLPEHRISLDIDYDRYGDGEAQLAWYDRSVDIHTLNNKAGVATQAIIELIHQSIRKKNLPIGHLKFFASGPNWQKKISFTTWKSPYNEIWDIPTVNNMQLLINARVQTEPEILDNLINAVLKEITNRYECSLLINRTHSFKPGYPTPTYRVAE